MENGQKSLIYITGFMGAGKSTIGPILANTIGFSFIDTDKEIIKKTGKSVAEIFSDLGETYFREIEHNLLREISARSQTVIALGGGTIAFERNMILIRSTGTLIYLRTDEESLFKRLIRNSERPLLKVPDHVVQDTEQLRQSVKSLLAVREQYYSQADIIISTSGKKVGITVDEIVKLLKSHLRCMFQK